MADNGVSIRKSASIIGSLASLLFGNIWGTLIIGTGATIAAGVNTVKGYHRANTVRSEEIVKQLMAARDKEEVKECLLMANELIKESILEAYKCGSMEMIDDYFEKSRNIKLLEGSLSNTDCSKYEVNRFVGTLDEQLQNELSYEINQFLEEDEDLLQEDVLNEGKLFNKLRWKLAKFTLKFIDDRAITEILLKYNTGKDSKFSVATK